MAFTVNPSLQSDTDDRPKVLIVDDQDMNLIALSALLSREPVRVLTANSGEAALTQILRHEFAVILLDVRMPDMDGYEAASLIREHTSGNPVPIVFLTAGDRDDLGRARGYASGAVDFLYKPVDENLVKSKVRVFVELYQHRRKLDQATRALRHSHNRVAQLLNAVGEGILGVDPDGTIGFANDAACRMLEGTKEQLVGRLAAAAIGFPSPAEAAGPFVIAIARGVYRCDEANLVTLRGRRFPVEFSIAALEAEENRGRSYVVAFQDISQRQTAAERLRLEASRDYLTDLNNRLMFERQLEQQIQSAAADGTKFALLFMDLDGFKPINDRYGHLLGDELLKAVAGRLRHNVRMGDVCARLGGDEFAILLAGIGSAEDALHAARALHRSVIAPYECGEVLLEVGASIGVAVYPADGADAGALIGASDAAMYRAKRDPTQSVVLVEPPG